MRMKQLLFVLLFHSFGTGYCQVLPDLKTMLVYVKLGSSSLATCQECILSIAGAVGARLITQRNVQSEVVFKVTASDFGFVMVQQYCSKTTQCDKLTVKNPSGSTFVPTLMQNQVPRVHEDPSNTILCLVATQSSTRCRACLRESSDSAYLGDFRLAALTCHHLHTIYLMSTSRKASDIVLPCIASQACTASTVQIQARTCAPLLLNGPMQDTPYKEEGTPFKYETRPNKESQMVTIQNHSRSVKLKEYCLSKHLKNRNDLTVILKEIAKVTNGFVVVLHHVTDSDNENSEPYYMHVLAQSFPSMNMKDGYVKLGSVKSLKVEEKAVCNERNALQFDTLPIKDQVSVSMSEEKRTMQKNIVIDYSTECVRASSKIIKECDECITKLGVTLNTNALLSKSTSLSYLTSNFDKRKLPSCIKSHIKSTTQCSHLVYVPNFMCEYEFQQHEQYVGHQQNHDNSAGTYQVTEESQNGLVLFVALRVGPSSFHLFGFPIHSEVNVMLVLYQEEGARDCLINLALRYDVLMISLEKRYIWMPYEPEITFQNVVCKGLTFVRSLYHNVDSMQSVSAINVNQLFTEFETGKGAHAVHLEEDASRSGAYMIQKNSHKKTRKLFSDRHNDGFDDDSEENSLSRAKTSDKMKWKNNMELPNVYQKIDPVSNYGHHKNDAIDTKLEYAKLPN
ncbi:hypothetical protein ABG067_007283 [Albugo candida]